MKIVVNYKKDEVEIYNLPLETDPNHQLKCYPIDILDNEKWDEIKKHLEVGEMPDELIENAPDELKDILSKNKEAFNNLNFSEKVKRKSELRATAKGIDELAQSMIIPNKVNGIDNVKTLRKIIEYLRLNDSEHMSVDDLVVVGKESTGVVITIT